MQSAHHARPAEVTWEEFIELDEDDPRELIDGALEETEVPTRLHEWIVGCIYAYLWNWARANSAGLVLPSSYKIRIDQKRGVMPDVVFIRKDRVPLSDNKGMSRAAPDLAVEVISPTSVKHDRIRKLQWYAEIGVAEYWLVDPEAKTIERFTLGGDGLYVVAGSAADDEIFQPTTFANLAIPLAELWTIPGDTPA